MTKRQQQKRRRIRRNIYLDSIVLDILVPVTPSIIFSILLVLGAS